MSLFLDPGIGPSGCGMWNTKTNQHYSFHAFLFSAISAGMSSWMLHCSLMLGWDEEDDHLHQMDAFSYLIN